MFKLDEIVKGKVLSKLSADSSLHYLLDHFWDQMVLYSLLFPLQWLHLTHLLYSTHWETYDQLTKVLMALYAASCFIVWEFGRIFMYYTCRAVASGEDDMKQLASRVASAASIIGKSGVDNAAPVMARLSQSAVDLFKDSVNQIKKKGSQLMANTTEPVATNEESAVETSVNARKSRKQ